MSEKINVISANIAGIKCDTKGCGWRNDSVHVSDYDSWLNAPCPKCGGNLLTQKDLDTVNRVFSMTEKINNWCNKWLPKKILKLLDSNGSRANHISFDMDGSGKLHHKK